MIFNQDRMERLVSISLSAVLAIPAVCLLAPLFLLYLLTIRDGGGFIYKGRRMGYGKRAFHMYKVRSLKVGAESRIRSKLHVSGSQEELWYGNFIRGTRLDELPQLINVFRGDMDFVGPRPERFEVYEAGLHLLPEYDLRFRVKPGLTGLSQLITPHSTPKRIRSAIDNKYFVHERSVARKYMLFLFTIRVFAWKILRETLRKTAEYALRMAQGRKLKSRREKPRFFPKDVYCSINILMDIDTEMQKIFSDILTNELKVKNVNSTEVLLEGKRETVNALINCLKRQERVSPQAVGAFDMKIQLKKGARFKVMNCMGRMVTTREAGQMRKQQMLLSYTAKSELDKYFIDKYLLNQSFSR